MLSIRDAVNNFVDYVDHAYQGQLYYEMTNRLISLCGTFCESDSKTVGVSMTISVSRDDVAYTGSYDYSGAPCISTHRYQTYDIVVIFENGQSSSEVKFTIDGSDRLTEFLSVFACFICLNDEHYLADDRLFELIPDNVDLSHIIRAIEIDHNVKLLSRMIEDIYYYCKDGSYKKHIGAMLDHFTSTEHNNPELTAVILNKSNELGIVNEEVPKLML